MWTPFEDLDRILRGEATRMSELRSGSVRFELSTVGPLLVMLAGVYGTFMGWYSLVNRADPVWAQPFASSIKVPLLFVLSFVVTFPSLYVFNALVGSRLRLMSLLRLLVGSLAVAVAVLASLGTIVGFFSVTTESYPFMVLFNVACFSVAGGLGLKFLLQTLRRLTLAQQDVDAVVAVDVGDPKPESHEGSRGGAATALAGPLEDVEGVLGPHVNAVFRVWVVLFALVGCQMAWVLRPFVGHPMLEFTWFRTRESNFFEAVVNHLLALFS